jgi:hypothetical protein
MREALHSRRLKPVLSALTGLAVALLMLAALGPLTPRAAALARIEQAGPLSVVCTSFPANSSGTCTVSGGAAGGTLSATVNGPVTPSGAIAGPACTGTCTWTFTLTGAGVAGPGSVTVSEAGCPAVRAPGCPPSASTNFTVTPVREPTPTPVPTPVPTPNPFPGVTICPGGIFVPAGAPCPLPPINSFPPPITSFPPASQPASQPPIATPTPLPSRSPVPVPSPSPSPTPSTAPATVTISNTNPVVITIHANQFLDLTHSVSIDVAPGVEVTGVQVTTGIATIQGNAVVWNGFTLNAGDDATATVSLATTPGAAQSAPGTPSIQSISLSALDANGQPVTQSVSAGGPPVDSLTPSSLAGALRLAVLIRPAAPSPAAPYRAAAQPVAGGGADPTLVHLLRWLALVAAVCLAAGAWLLLRGRDRPARE